VNEYAAKAAIAVAVMAALGTVGAQPESDVATGCLIRSGPIIEGDMGHQPARGA
jgi:hypothetical protein